MNKLISGIIYLLTPFYILCHVWLEAITIAGEFIIEEWQNIVFVIIAFGSLVFVSWLGYLLCTILLF